MCIKRVKRTLKHGKIPPRVGADSVRKLANNLSEQCDITGKARAARKKGGGRRSKKSEQARTADDAEEKQNERYKKVGSKRRTTLLGRVAKEREPED